MAINTAKQKLGSGQRALGAVASFGSYLAAEQLARAGYDFVIVDCQHGNWSDDTALLAFRAISLGGSIPMARVRQNDFYAIGRLLDRGALGVIIPMVNTADEARAAANAVRYPPLGGRSWGPTLASHHGPGYGDWAQEQLFLGVQIESIQAVEQAEAIMAVDGVDACWIGPNDLARSMGVDVATPDGRAAHEAAVLRVLAACQKTHKFAGIDASGEVTARRWLDPGFQFVTITSDFKLLTRGGPAALEELGLK